MGERTPWDKAAAQGWECRIWWHDAEREVGRCVLERGSQRVAINWHAPDALSVLHEAARRALDVEKEVR